MSSYYGGNYWRARWASWQDARAGRRAQARRAGLDLGAESATHCVDCDGPIAQERRLALAGVQRCVYCAAALERQRRKW